MEKNIKISIILPTYNGEHYIKRAIGSVISQTFSKWELIIIDDGSVDDTKRIVKEYSNKEARIIYIKNETNLGIQKTLNRGLKEAKGDYIARIDNDDEWIDKEKLQKQFEFLENNNSYVLVGTGAIVVNETEKELFKYLLPETDQEIRNKLLMKNCFIHSSVLLRKNSVLNFSGYDESIESKHLEDYDLWLKLGTIGKLANLHIYGIKFTMRDDSISSNNKLEQFRKDLILIKKYKNKYPKYFESIIFGYSRLFFYKIFDLFPYLLKNRILKLYKEY